MLQSIPGVYKHGKIELGELPFDVSESRVIVTFLEFDKTSVKSKIMQFGMFSKDRQSSEADFQIAEFKGDEEDSLDWS
ncbi:hypothetical protein [Merismopedia glauca]|uniref:Uncharacterized protein n=1 Tax=Merismopedia glauca CCAP 1448/3 TaxID=1296344 RepID=A0A2T1C3Z0_9CYAN|nr:hypothetical protein [Merismopedia glauca]PSB02990.1 hypothetical protein C7B64_10705 [Merismopedia glauca CCAP 1448/3]